MNKKILTILSFIPASAVCAALMQDKKPNIVIILADDQGWGDLGITGNTNVETPNIDQLAKKGVIFDRFYVCPVSSPTRAELLTGRYHPRGGVFSTSSGGERLDLDEITIADYFKKAGYTTAAYGKWHNGTQPPYHPNARGFDDFYGFCSGHWGNYFSPMLEHNGKIVQGNGFIIDDLTDRGIAFIEKNRNGPFLLYLPYNTPHSPMQVPDKWWNKLESTKLKMRYQEPEQEDTLFTKAALAMTENIDWNVGRIINKIEELNLSENTIVVYLSDNGPNSWRWNGNMKGRKGSTDEGGVRAPFIIKWGGKIPAGKKVTEIAAAIDLLPTLADLAGFDFNPKKPLDGISLKPLLFKKNDYVCNSRFIISHWGGKTSVRNQRYRLDNEGKLFDIINDPEQNEDVSNKYPEITNTLQNERAKWEKEVLSELSRRDTRPFTIGHPEFAFTHIPARDGIAKGNIRRSNKFPNDSYFTNWTSTSDSIVWKVDVVSDGRFEVEIYYTCPPEDVGAIIELSFADKKLVNKVSEAYNPPLMGKENDRVTRQESYVKNFKPMKMGTINLKEGQGELILKALEIPGKQAIDFKMITLKKLN
ncbi:MAG: arylsulfatase [Proteiniphilum sp.]